MRHEWIRVESLEGGSETRSTIRSELVGHNRPMRMTVGPSQVDQVTLWLTRAEIADMIAALQALDDNFLEPGWHAHVQPEDGANLELTVAPGSISPPD